MGVYRGCGKCQGCFNRFAQATLIIKCVSGVSDQTVLMHLGVVFVSKRFRDNARIFEKHLMAHHSECVDDPIPTNAIVIASSAKWSTTRTKLSHAQHRRFLETCSEGQICNSSQKRVTPLLCLMGSCTGHRQEAKGEATQHCGGHIMHDTPTGRAAGKSGSLLMPSPIAVLSYPFGSQLKEWEKGVEVDCGEDWTVEQIELAIPQGPHRSALTEEAIELFAEDLAYQVKAGFSEIVLASNLMADPPDQSDSLFDEYGDYRHRPVVASADVYDAEGLCDEILTNENISHDIYGETEYYDPADNNKISINERRIEPQERNYDALRPNFGWLPAENVKKTFEATTQNARMPHSTILRKHY
jgi:hypothetical protein